MDRLAPHGADPAFRGTGRSARHAVDFRAGGGELGPRRDAESRLRLQVPAAPRPPRAAPPDTVAVPPAPLVLPRPSRLLRPSPRPRLPAPPPEAAPAARSIPRRRRGKDVAEAPPPPPPVPAPVRPLRRPPRLRRGYSLRDAPRLDRRAARRARADEGRRAAVDDDAREGGGAVGHGTRLGRRRRRAARGAPSHAPVVVLSLVVGAAPPQVLGSTEGGRRRPRAARRGRARHQDVGGAVRRAPRLSRRDRPREHPQVLRAEPRPRPVGRRAARPVQAHVARPVVDAHARPGRPARTPRVQVVRPRGVHRVLGELAHRATAVPVRARQRRRPAQVPRQPGAGGVRQPAEDGVQEALPGATDESHRGEDQGPERAGVQVGDTSEQDAVGHEARGAEAVQGGTRPLQRPLHLPPEPAPGLLGLQAEGAVPHLSEEGPAHARGEGADVPHDAPADSEAGGVRVRLVAAEEDRQVKG
mmetsp:Transcript_37921/g.90728  ORF Transcript_37921/g.90728 Transcript_37921/m.90728 type:complete len:472 (-) Transcript_37921:123-1538(-)